MVLRPPPDVALYHRAGNPLFPRTLEQLGRRDDVHAVVLPRTEEQRAYVGSLALPSVIVPDGAVDAQSLIAAADLVISAGGTMNREAVALGVPVYTEFAGRLGGVDEQLIREGRLRVLTGTRQRSRSRRGRTAVLAASATRARYSRFFFRRPGTPSRVRSTSRRGRDPDVQSTTIARRHCRSGRSSRRGRCERGLG